MTQPTVCPAPVVGTKRGEPALRGVPAARMFQCWQRINASSDEGVRAAVEETQAVVFGLGSSARTYGSSFDRAREWHAIECHDGVDLFIIQLRRCNAA